MRITEKIDLIRDLSLALISKYDKKELQMFFEHYKLKVIMEGWGNNEEDYEVDAKRTLANADEKTLINISTELAIGEQYILPAMPKNWLNSHNTFKIFISHLSSQKELAKNLKEALKPYYIDCFVAHEDIYPSLEWQDEIQKALHSMNAFISMHLEGFKASEWCQQEIGAAVMRNVKIIPIKFDGKEDPTGFIARIQGLTRSGKNRNDLAKEIVNIIKQDSKTKEIYAQICEQHVDELFTEDEIPF